MFSGKTEELIRRVKRAMYARQRVQAFKPRIDDRYDASSIVTHAAAEEGDKTGVLEALAVATSESLESRVDDETHIVDVAQRLADRGVRVLVAGLDQDYLGRPFHPMPELMAVAEQVTKVHAVCTVCGDTASRSQRLVAEGPTVLVGGSESYEARCRACFEPRDVTRTPE